MHRVIGVLSACVLLADGPAHAASVLVEMSFEDPEWTGSFRYDDSTRMSHQDVYFGYTLDSFTITWQGITWDESDIFQTDRPNVVEDSYGKVVFFERVEDVLSGAIIGGYYSVLVLPIDYDIQQSWLQLTIDCPPDCSSPDFHYTTTVVPEPGPAGPLALGLLGLALARRASRLSGRCGHPRALAPPRRCRPSTGGTSGRCAGSRAPSRTRPRSRGAPG